MNDKRNKWLEKSYALVAKKGIEYLTVNSISREVGKSKSSFYHFFGDLELFKKDLIEFHVQKMNKFSAHVAECENIYPGLIDVFLDHQLDIFFHKQLRIHRNESTNKNYIEKVFESYERSVLDKWDVHFGLNHQKIFSKKLNRFISEHFFLSITPEDYNFDWLKKYLDDISDLIRHMKSVQ